MTVQACLAFPLSEGDVRLCYKMLLSTNTKGARGNLNCRDGAS